jgi:hypothetical protein
LIPQSHSAGRFIMWARATPEDCQRYIDESAELLDPDLVRYIKRYNALHQQLRENITRMARPFMVLPEWPPAWVGWP